jgi:hypothetical protein
VEILTALCRGRATARDEKLAWPRGILIAGAVASALFCMTPIVVADTPVALEAQVKAAFLFNFTKYVDWPAAAFTNAAEPIVIGVMGADGFGDTLRHNVMGKTINGRPVVIKHLDSDLQISECQILFVSHSEASRTSAILDKAGAFPILSVGEDGQFMRYGGVINFVLRNGNVRLEINLIAARKAGLTISSRLLAVADTVEGK